MLSGPKMRLGGVRTVNREYTIYFMCHGIVYDSRSYVWIHTFASRIIFARRRHLSLIFFRIIYIQLLRLDRV